jgi:hypothetical protein
MPQKKVILSIPEFIHNLCIAVSERTYSEGLRPPVTSHAPTHYCVPSPGGPIQGPLSLGLSTEFFLRNLSLWDENSLWRWEGEMKVFPLHSDSVVGPFLLLFLSPSLSLALDPEKYRCFLFRSLSAVKLPLYLC